MNPLLMAPLLVLLQIGPGGDPIVVNDRDECSPFLLCGRSCKPVPGEVDRCALYWVLKFVDRGLILNEPEWSPAKEPATCGRAVTHNLDALAGFYAKRPEISVPNAALLEILAGLEIPALPPAAGEEGAVADDPQKPLLARLREAQGRLTNLGPRIDRYESYVGTSLSWSASLEAAKRLDRRSAGIDTALSTGVAWPALDDFAVATWKLTVCDSLRADQVAERKRRMEEGAPQSVWSFAFAEDWVTLTNPFGEPALDRFGALGRPFFVEAREVAGERQEKSLFTQREVRKFREGVAALALKIGPLVTDRQTQQAAVLIALRGTFASETAVVATLHAAFDREEKEHAAKKNELDQAVSARQQLAASIGQQQARIKETDQRLTELRKASQSAEAAHVGAEAVAQGARERQEAALAQLVAIRLDCVGADYASCTNAAAKLEYDRRRYEAQSALSAARQEFLERLKQGIDALEQVGAADRRVVDQEGTAAELRIALADLLQKVDGAEKLVKRLEGEWRRVEEEIAPLRSAIKEVDETAAAIKVRLGK